MRTHIGLIATLVSYTLLTASAARAEGPDIVQGPPPGWDVVDITADGESDQTPAMNNRGQIVFSRRFIPNPNGTQEEIFLYDNGKLRQITDNNVADQRPAINDAGVMVWAQRTSGGGGNFNVVRYEDGVVEVLTDTPYDEFCQKIDNTGRIMWSAHLGPSRDELFEWRDGVITQLTNNGLSNQFVRLADNGDYAWTRYDFNAEPFWRSTIMASIGGEILELTDGTTQLQGNDLNDSGRVVWVAPDEINVWEDGITTTIPGTEDTAALSLNCAGDIYFPKWTGESWDAFLYRDGVLFQLSEVPWTEANGDINGEGRACWNGGPSGQRDVRVFSRTRSQGDFNGDANVDPFDLESFENCRSNLECGTPVPPVCLDVFDADNDGDLDFHDFGAFQRLVTPNP